MSLRKRFGDLSIGGDKNTKVAKQVILPNMNIVKGWTFLLVFLINTYNVHSQKVIFSNDGLTIHAVKSTSHDMLLRENVDKVVKIIMEKTRDTDLESKGDIQIAHLKQLKNDWQEMTKFQLHEINSNAGNDTISHIRSC